MEHQVKEVKISTTLYLTIAKNENMSKTVSLTLKKPSKNYTFLFWDVSD